MTVSSDPDRASSVESDGESSHAQTLKIAHWQFELKTEKMN